MACSGKGNTPPSVPQLRYRRRQWLSSVHLPEAHFSLYDFVRMTSANITSDLWHTALAAAFWRSAPGIFWFTFAAQFLGGTYQGYRRLSLEWNALAVAANVLCTGWEAPQNLSAQWIRSI